MRAAIDEEGLQVVAERGGIIVDGELGEREVTVPVGFESVGVDAQRIAWPSGSARIAWPSGSGRRASPTRKAVTRANTTAAAWPAVECWIQPRSSHRQSVASPRATAALARRPSRAQVPCRGPASCRAEPGGPTHWHPASQRTWP